MKFAKLFDTPYGQVLAMIQPNDDGNPEIRFFHKPEHFDVCSVAYSFKEEDWGRAEEGFEKVDMETAIKAALSIRNITEGEDE